MRDLLERYTEAIRAQLPSLHVHSVHLNRDGLQNDVVVVNHELVFRFAKTAQATALLDYERRLLPIIERQVTLPVPHIDLWSETFLHYRLVPGVPLYRHVLLRSDETTQAALAHALATFLRQLHAIPLTEVPTLPQHADVPPVSRRERYERRLQDLEQVVYPYLWADQKAWIEDLFAPVLDGRVDLDAFGAVLTHRDLAAYHILHDPQAGQLTGVIDFGTAGAGDAAVDWACLINTYGETFVQRMARTYPLDQATVDRARFLAGALELEWALGGVQGNDVSLLLVHLGRARDSRPLLAPWP